MTGWLGLDADSWGNVIAAGTTAGAIIGGALSVSRTARLNREARAEEREADREAELRAQSREALARVMDAATRFLDVMRARKARRQRGEPEAHDDRAAQLRETREVLSAALLVHDKEVRESLVRGVNAFQNAAWLVDEDGWEFDRMDARETRILSTMRELAAAYLRADEAGQARAYNQIQRDWKLADDARQKYDRANREPDKT